MHDENFSIEQRPLLVGYGDCLDDMIDFTVIMNEIRCHLNSEEGPEIPEGILVNDSTYNEYEFFIRIYGKTVLQKSVEGYTEVQIENTFRDCYTEVIRQYRNMFNPEYLFHALNLDEMQKTRSYDAYRMLYVYYNRIVKDRKQAFHWIKMMSRFRVPKSLGILADYYDKGYGCRKSEYKSRKILRSIGYREYDDAIF